MLEVVQSDYSKLETTTAAQEVAAEKARTGEKCRLPWMEDILHHLKPLKTLFYIFEHRTFARQTWIYYLNTTSLRPHERQQHGSPKYNGIPITA